MPQSKSAWKRLRQNEVQRNRNRTIKSSIRTRTNAFQDRISGGEKEAATAELKNVTSLLDKATIRGVIKKNYASRKKSQLSRALNSIS
ncbi:MAG: 30S ribosomal protein S20 [Candidatus Auribacterota bacterium]|nr:30S ribosomal protein S20 [Candidatus Auribacterota bacterium]